MNHDVKPTLYFQNFSFQPLSVWENIKDIIAKYDLLSHSFYRLFTEGRLSRAVLQHYAQEYYTLEKNIPSCLETLAAPGNEKKIGDLSFVRQNLADEVGGEGRPSHLELWMRFGCALGLSRTEIQQARPLFSTRDTVTTLAQLCMDEPLEALGAFFAYEIQIPGIAEAKSKSLREFYGVQDPAVLAFFAEHEKTDTVHAAHWWHMMVTRPIADMDTVMTGVAVGAQALHDFLSGIEEAFVGASASPELYGDDEEEPDVGPQRSYGGVY